MEQVRLPTTQKEIVLPMQQEMEMVQTTRMAARRVRRRMAKTMEQKQALPQRTLQPPVNLNRLTQLTTDLPQMTKLKMEERRLRMPMVTTCSSKKRILRLEQMLKPELMKPELMLKMQQMLKQKVMKPELMLKLAQT